jgi:iron(III) transport system substrate-binding protein
MTVRSIPLRAAAAALGVGVLVAACGSSPTDTAPAAQPQVEDGSTLEGVYEAVDGLEGQERFDKLVQLAEDAGGSCSYYHVGKQDKDVEAFNERTGLTVEGFQSTAERMAERVSNEQKANQVGSSVILGSLAEIQELQRQGALAQLNTPTTETVEDDFKGDGWVSPIALMQMPTYNTDKLKAEDAPKTWEEFFTSFDGRKAIEITTWPWFATIVQQYFVEQKGMTEEAAIEMIQNSLRGASTVDGNVLVPSLLASGQFDYVPNAYAHAATALEKKGAPITFAETSEDMPPAIFALGMALTANSPNPACGLAFLEWSMSEEGQDVVASKNYVPTASTYGGETLLEQHPNALFQSIDLAPREEQEEWRAKFDKMLRDAGTQQPIKEDS